MRSNVALKTVSTVVAATALSLAACEPQAETRSEELGAEAAAEAPADPSADNPVSASASEEAFTRTAADVEWGPCPEFMPEGCALAVAQGDPAEPNADVLFRMATNTTIPEHTHTSPERMVLLAGEMHVDYEGQETVVLTPGSYAYGPAELPHSAFCAEGEDCLLFIAFEDPVDAEPVE